MKLLKSALLLVLSSIAAHAAPIHTELLYMVLSNGRGITLSPDAAGNPPANSIFMYNADHTLRQFAWVPKIRAAICIKYVELHSAVWTPSGLTVAFNWAMRRQSDGMYIATEYHDEIDSYNVHYSVSTFTPDHVALSLTDRCFFDVAGSTSNGTLASYAAGGGYFPWAVVSYTVEGE